MSNVSSQKTVYEQEASSKDKLWDKAKRQPFVPLGIIGAMASLGWGAYSFRHRGQMSTSQFMMQLRVQTQSMLVGAMTVGIIYTLFKDHWHKNGHDNHASENK